MGKLPMGFFRNFWVQVALWTTLLVGGLREGAIILGGIDTSLSVVALVIWLFGLLATPWAGLILVAVVVLMLWRGIRQVSRAAADGDASLRRLEDERSTAQSDLRQWQSQFAETISSTILAHLKDTAALAESFGQLLSMRDGLARVEKLKREISQYANSLEQQEQNPAPYDPEEGNPNSIPRSLARQLDAMAVEHGLTPIQLSNPRPITEGVPNDGGRATVRLVKGKNDHFFQDHRTNIHALNKRADELQNFYFSTATNLERAAAERLKKLNVTPKR